MSRGSGQGTGRRSGRGSERRRSRRIIAPRNLRKLGAEAPGWRAGDRDGAPRLAADEFIGRGVTRLGRFAKTDPLTVPRAWGAEWLGLIFWAGLTGGSLYKARRDARAAASAEAPPGDPDAAGRNGQPEG